MWQALKTLFETFFSLLQSAKQKQAESDADTGQKVLKQVEEEAHGQ